MPINMDDWTAVSPDVERLAVPGGWLYRVNDAETDALLWCGFVADPPAGDAIARALRDLGNGNAATQIGAIEGLAMKLGEAIEAVAASMRERG